ncbi:transcription elongation regulator 1-like protein [Aplochiton taeniatus]
MMLPASSLQGQAAGAPWLFHTDGPGQVWMFPPRPPPPEPLPPWMLSLPPLPLYRPPAQPQYSLAQWELYPVLPPLYHPPLLPNSWIHTLPEHKFLRVSLGEEEEEEKDEESRSKHKRPVASTPVPGSPWCVVWTGDDRVFFFNPTIQLSVWERPLDLIGQDINRIIEDPPHKRKKTSPSEGSTGPEDDDDDDDDDEERHISKTKRNRLEEPLSWVTGSLQQGEQKTDASSCQHKLLPLDLRISHFRDMLLERGVSAFSSWDKELHKIVFDPRYLLLTSDQRKQVFEEFVKARMQQENREKRSRLLQAKEDFRVLLEEAGVTGRSSFREFSERCGQDPRFQKLQKRKDKETIFNHYIINLRRRERENRPRLHRMK